MVVPPARTQATDYAEAGSPNGREVSGVSPDDLRDKARLPMLS